MRRSLEHLSDASMARLAVTTSVTPPKAIRSAPIFWEYFSDSVACEVARRRGLMDYEPPLPSLSCEELEAGAEFLALIAPLEADDTETGAELHYALVEIANGLLTLRRLVGDEHEKAH